MPIGRGIMQMDRINVYPTTASFLSIYPASPASCGDILTFNIKITNTRDPAIIPTGTASVMDLNTGNVLGTATLDAATGIGVIVSLNNSGNLNLVVRYNGGIVHGMDGYSITRQFGSSVSSAQLYNINLLETATTVSVPTDGSGYCAAQDTPIESFTHLAGTIESYPTNGYVQFLLWLDAINSIVLPYASVDGYGVARSYIPANVTGLLGDAFDGYYLQAIFMGSETGCFAGSSSPGGIAGTKIIPSAGDTVNVALSVSSPPGGICFNSYTTATVNVTGTSLGTPQFGRVNIFVVGSEADIVGEGEIIDGYANIIIDGYRFPEVDTYPHTFQLRAKYFNGAPCYSDGYSPLEPPVQLTISKNTVTLDTPTTSIPDLCASAPFNFSCQINAPTNLDGYFRFDLYRADIPNSFVTSFGVQSITSPGTIIVVGTILPHIMSYPNNYYVVGVYVANGNNCYVTDAVVSSHSVTLNPANC